MKNDQELVNKIRRGDKEAFSLLVKDLMPSAYKTAYLILRSKEHAEDALQNALEGAYISIMKNKNMTNFKAWFFRIVYSRSIDIYRKNNRHLHIDIDNHSEEQLIEKTESAQQIAIQKENKNEMISHIMKLKREQSVPLLLHYYEDLTVKEISLILNENMNTVKTRMKRGKQKLAEIMGKRKNFSQEVKTNGI
ncbi:RNA polymerase sigma factor [Peribacillus sp. FSL K6-1552]|uniref:RNA polymerase sigma factor n=1 Tax=Peribacillus sp. FSL K6-1552 TaxID=2954514 RepID=UPI0030FABBE3